MPLLLLLALTQSATVSKPVIVSVRVVCQYGSTNGHCNKTPPKPVVVNGWKVY
jgi:hypothetical protein